MNRTSRLVSALAVFAAISIFSAGCSVGVASLPELPPVPVLTILTTTVPAGFIGTAYPPPGGGGAALMTAGGVPPLSSCVVVSGALPMGLTVGVNPADRTQCLISGTISMTEMPGTFTFTIRAADSSTPPVLDTQSYTMTVGPAFFLLPITFQQGVQGRAYNKVLPTTGGNMGNLANCMQTGLPTGLTVAVSGRNCVISGMPSVNGSFNVTITAVDNNVPSQPPNTMQSATLVINPVLAVPAFTFNAAIVDTMFSQAIPTTGGIRPLQMCTATGLPMGFTVAPDPLNTATNVNNCVVSGMSAAAGTFNIVVTALDSASCDPTQPAPVGTCPGGSSTVTASGMGSSASTALTVNTRATTTAVALAPSTVLVDQASMITVTVTDVQATGTKSSPTGTVTFMSSVGSDMFAGTCTLAAAGADSSTCTAMVTPTVDGTVHTITANFAVTTKHTASTGNAQLTTTLRPTTTAVMLNPASTSVNTPTMVTVTVTDTAAGGTASSPAGTIVINSDDATDTIGTCTLAAAGAGVSTCTANLTPTQLGSGMRSITASYTANDNKHADSNSNATPQILLVTARITSTTVMLAPSTVFVNQGSTVTVTVTDTDPNPGATAPGGTIIISSGDATDTITVCTLAAASGTTSQCTATLTPTLFNGGSRSVTASYSPTDGDHANSDSTLTPQILTVNARTTTATTTLNPTSVLVGEPSTVTVVVMDTAGAGTTVTPVGTVTVMSDVGTDVFTGTCTLAQTVLGTASCNAVMVTPAMVAGGTHNITANFAATNNIHANSSDAAALTVNARATTSTVSLTLTTVFANSGTLATVTVTDAEATGTATPPTGIVTFTGEAGDVLASPISGNNTCALVPIPASMPPASSCVMGVRAMMVGDGVHTIMASYAANDDIHANSSGSADLTVNARTTTTEVILKVNSVFVGEPVGTTVRITDTVAAGAPTPPVGTVAVVSSVGAADMIGTCTLAAIGLNTSECSFDITPQMVAGGMHSITASFAATDDVHANSDSNATPQTFTVNPRSTATMITLTPSTVDVNQPTSVMVTVTDTQGVGAVFVPGGTIAIMTDNGTDTIGTCTLAMAGAGVATCMANVTPTQVGSGSRMISASYTATDDVHTDSMAAAQTLTVNARTTTTMIAFTPASVAVGEMSTITVTVTDSSPGTAVNPTGDVTVMLGAGFTDMLSSGMCTLVGMGGGVSTCTVTTTAAAPVGAHPYTATYGGDSIHSGSMSAATNLNVTLRQTMTAVTFMTNPLDIDDTTTVTATVTDISGGTQSDPAGTVTFMSGVGGDVFTPGTADCTLVGMGGGVSTCTVMITPVAPAGMHLITANYAGDMVNHDPSSGNANLTVTLRDTQTVAAFTLGSVNVNQADTITVTVTDNDSGTQTPPGVGNMIVLMGETGDVFGTCTLAQTGANTSECTASVTPGEFGDGTHTVTATFGATSLHNTSNTMADLSVVRRDTTTTAALTNGTTFVNAPDTITVTVSDVDPDGTAVTPTGTISFNFETGDVISTCTLAETVPGQAQCNASVTPSQVGDGTHTIEAVFLDSNVHSTSSDVGQDLTVNARTVTVTVTFSPDPSGDPVTVFETVDVVVTVTDDVGDGNALDPAGTISVMSTVGADMLTNAGACTLTGQTGGVSTCSVTLTPVTAGMRDLTASFTDTATGRVHEDDASAATTLTVNARATTTTVTFSVNPVGVGGMTMVTATVTDVEVDGTASFPQGTVQFVSDDGADVFTPMDTCTLGNSMMAGTSTCFVTLTASANTGTHSITAAFSADTGVPVHSDSISGMTLLDVQQIVLQAFTWDAGTEQRAITTQNINLSGTVGANPTCSIMDDQANTLATGLTATYTAGPDRCVITGAPPDGSGMAAGRTYTVTICYDDDNLTDPGTCQMSMITIFQELAFVTGATLPEATQNGATYTTTIMTAGGQPARMTAEMGASLNAGNCAGLTGSDSTGNFTVTGMPTASGTCTFTVRVTDTARTPSPAGMVDVVFSIAVAPALNITKPTAASALVNALAGSTYTGDTFTATGGRPAAGPVYNWSISGGNGAFNCTAGTCTGTTGACTGFTLNQTTGAFAHSSTPSTTGTCTMNVTVTEVPDGASAAAQTAGTDTENSISFFVLGTFTYVADPANNQVNVINTSSDTETGTIDLTPIGASRGPHSVAVRRDGTRAYVTLETTNQLAVINTTDNSLDTANTLAIPGGCTGPRGIAIGTTGNAKDRAYIACTNDAVEVVDVSGATPVHLRTIDLNAAAIANGALNDAGEEGVGIDISPDGSLVYVAISAEDRALRISTNANVANDTGLHTDNVLQNGAANAQHVAFSANGTLVYYTDPGRDEVQIVVAATPAGGTTVQIPVFNGLDPERIVRDPNTGRVFVAMSSTGQLDPQDANTTMGFVMPIEANATTASKQIDVGTNNADRSGGVTTIAFNSHPFVMGDIISVDGMTGGGGGCGSTMNGIFTVTSAATDSFTYAQTGQADCTDAENATIVLLISVGTTAPRGAAAPADNAKAYFGISDAVSRRNDTFPFASAGANITLSGGSASTPRGMGSIRNPLP